MSKAWNPPSSRPIRIYFEFRSKPSLITVISMDPRPTNHLRQNIVFSYLEMIRVSFSLFLSLSVFCYSTLLLIFIKIISLLSLFYWFIFRKIIFIFSCSGMFRNVPECSGMFRVLSTPAKFIFWKLLLEFRYAYLNKPFGFHLPPREVQSTEILINCQAYANFKSQIWDWERLTVLSQQLPQRSLDTWKFFKLRAPLNEFLQF